METILVNPKKKKRAKKNVEELLLVNPKRKRKRARKNLEEGLFLVNPTRRRRVKKNPLSAKISAKSMVSALIGGMLQGVTEGVLKNIKTKDGKEIIPAPIRTAAFPVVAYLLSESLPLGKEIALGSIGAAGEKVGSQLLKIALPQDIKTKLGLSGTDEDEIPEIRGLSDDEKELIRELIPYVLEYKNKINTALSSPTRVIIRTESPTIPISRPDGEILSKK